MSRKLRLLIAVPVVLLIASVGGTWVYLNLIRDEAPAPLAVDGPGDASGDTPARSAGSSAAVGGTDGMWEVSEGSQAGYRVKEILFGQSAVAVGRTSEVKGTFTVSGTTIQAASFEVDMASMTSDESQRDGQFRGRIMQVDRHPTSTFTLTQPLPLEALPGEGLETRVDVVGDLTLKGTKRPVTIPLTVVRTGGSVKVAGSYEVVFEDWGIGNPSGGPASVGDVGQLEFLLVLERGS